MVGFGVSANVMPSPPFSLVSSEASRPTGNLAGANTGRVISPADIHNVAEPAKGCKIDLLVDTCASHIVLPRFCTRAGPRITPVAVDMIGHRLAPARYLDMKSASPLSDNPAQVRLWVYDGRVRASTGGR